MSDETTPDHQSSALAQQLVRLHGPLLSGEPLWRNLGFRSSDAFRQAKSRGHVEVTTFKLPGRRATFARTRDVADWIEKLEETAM
ncbi:hypothetical protein [Croceibacterium ferulae]|uniref:hypothetical protein n=1 Tax=Croceibacterium ferulae TaxID=1854641 RepID=UPI000EB44541|nr:hypothetical protein [Croceibacterium ferulae]